MFLGLYNGELENDLGLWRGWGVFEAMEARRKVIFHWDDHYERLLNSCQKSFIPTDSFKEPHLLRAQIEAEIGFLGFKESLVKLLITRGKSADHKHPSGEPNMLFKIFPLAPPADKPLKLVVYNAVKSNFPEVKSTGPYHDGMVLKKMAQEEGFDDFLYFSPESGIKETSGANIFFVLDHCSGLKVLMTPCDNILFGVTRSLVVEIAKKNSNFFYCVWEMASTFFTKNLLEEAKECFITSTTLGVRKVEIIQFMDGTAYKFEANAASSRIKKGFLKYRESYFKKHGA